MAVSSTSKVAFGLAAAAVLISWLYLGTGPGTGTGAIPPPADGPGPERGAGAASALSPTPERVAAVRAQRFSIVDDSGAPLASARLYFFDEPAGHRWRTWTPESPKVVLGHPAGRVQGFGPREDAPVGERKSDYEFASEVVELAGDVPGDSPGQEALSSLVLVVQERQGIVGTVAQGEAQSWARQFQMFAYPADGDRVLRRGDVCRTGLRTECEPYTIDGTHFILSSMNPGLYTVGIRYPDGVVRATKTVRVGQGLKRVSLEVETPALGDQLAIQWDGVSEGASDGVSDGQLQDISYRIESRVEGLPGEDFHRIEDAVWIQSAEGTHQLDLRWVPGKGSFSNVPNSARAKTWLHVQSRAHGYRAFEFNGGVLRRGPGGSRPSRPLVLPMGSTADVRVVLEGASPAARYEVLAYAERTPWIGDVDVPVCSHAQRASATLHRSLRDSPAMDYFAADFPLAAGARSTIVVRQTNERDWIAPIDLAVTSAFIEPPALDDGLDDGPVRISVALPPVRDLIVSIEGAATGTTAIGLEAQMPNRSWRLIMTGHVAAELPFQASNLPEGHYRIRHYGTGVRTPFDLGPEGQHRGPFTLRLCPGEAP